LPDWQTIKDLIQTLGWTKGVFTVFFFLAHAYIFSLYRGRLKDRQIEIDRLAKDNHEYRDRFLALLDRHFGYEPNDKHQTSTAHITISAAERVDDSEPNEPKQLERPRKGVFGKLKEAARSRRRKRKKGENGPAKTKPRSPSGKGD